MLMTCFASDTKRLRPSAMPIEPFKYCHGINIKGDCALRYSHVAIGFGELWLKGRNRRSFIEALHRNIRAALEGESYERLENVRDRFVLHLDDGSDTRSVLRKLGLVFGISWYAPVVMARNDIASIAKCAGGIVEPGSEVRIVAHRSMKRVGFSSQDIVNALIGRSKRLGFGMDKHARRKLYITVTEQGTMLHTRKIQGLGGLPVGTAGRAVILLSGGIDSPVASFYAMKRGLAPIYAHVHAFQSNDDERLSKIDRLAKALSKFHGGARAYYLPGYVFQSCAVGASAKYGNVLFKRFLYRVAERIAKSERAQCIVTGESLGQVASQTITNLSATGKGIGCFIMRPLIGMDKQEIVNAAKRLGTFDISIGAYKDVCQTTSRRTVLSCDGKELLRLYRKAKLDGAVRMTLSRARRFSLP